MEIAFFFSIYSWCIVYIYFIKSINNFPYVHDPETLLFSLPSQVESEQLNSSTRARHPPTARPIGGYANFKDSLNFVKGENLN